MWYWRLGFAGVWKREMLEGVRKVVDALLSGRGVAWVSV